jgi:hypothetical protein
MVNCNAMNKGTKQFITDNQRFWNIRDSYKMYSKIYIPGLYGCGSETHLLIKFLIVML